MAFWEGEKIANRPADTIAIIINDDQIRLSVVIKYQNTPFLLITMAHPTIQLIQLQNLQINPLPLHTFKNQ